MCSTKLHLFTYVRLCLVDSYLADSGGALLMDFIDMTVASINRTSNSQYDLLKLHHQRCYRRGAAADI